MTLPPLSHPEEQTKRVNVVTIPVADQVYEICTSIKAYFTPNPIDIALEERNVEFVASHTNLVILKSCAGATPAR